MMFSSNANEVAQQIEKFRQELIRQSRATVKDMAEYSANGVKRVIGTSPRVDTGELWNGIIFDFNPTPGGAEAVVHPSTEADKYALFVEVDTKPHWPPKGALEGWADRHGIPEFLVRQAIAKRGTKGIHMFEIAYEQLIKEAPNMVRVMVNRVQRYA